MSRCLSLSRSLFLSPWLWLILWLSLSRFLSRSRLLLLLRSDMDLVARMVWWSWLIAAICLHQAAIVSSWSPSGRGAEHSYVQHNRWTKIPITTCPWAKRAWHAWQRNQACEALPLL